jgi:hypothetical protein
VPLDTIAPPTRPIDTPKPIAKPGDTRDSSFTTTCMSIGLPTPRMPPAGESCSGVSFARSFATRFLTDAPSIASKPNVLAICFISSNGCSLPCSSAGIFGASLVSHHWRTILPTIWVCSSSSNMATW